jgi:hypothetical protein
MKGKTIAEIADPNSVTVHVMLPKSLLKWAAGFAREQGHGDIQVVVRQAIDLLIARHKAGSSA